jgi:hypothetical protein
LHLRIYHERAPRKDRSCLRIADIFCYEGSFKRFPVRSIFVADCVTKSVQKIAPSLFLQEKKTRRREEKTGLALFPLNPHRESRDQPSCCRPFRRNGPGLEHRL